MTRVCNNDMAGNCRLCMFSATRHTVGCGCAAARDQTRITMHCVPVPHAPKQLEMIYCAMCIAFVIMFIDCLFTLHVQKLFCSPHIAISFEATPFDIGNALNWPRMPQVDHIWDSKNDSKTQTQYSCMSWAHSGRPKLFETHHPRSKYS